MADEKVEKKYVKLGKNATSFSDNLTKVKVLPNQVVELSLRQAGSQKIAAALAGGHLVYADSSEVEASLKSAPAASTEPEAEKTELEKFSALKVEGMKAYLKENYELDEEELASITKMKKRDELIAYFQELESDDEDETEEA